MNGEQLGERALRAGDHITFGAHGPEVEVRPRGRYQACLWRASAVSSTASKQAPRSTTERIAIAVSEQTSKLQRNLLIAVVLLGIGIGVAYIVGHRQSLAQVQQLKAQNDSRSHRRAAARWARWPTRGS